MFRAIRSKNFPPFENLQLELPPISEKPASLAEVHLFTGVNGTGKTRLLCALAAALGFTQPLQKRLKGLTSPVSLLVTDQPTSIPEHNRFSAIEVSAERGGAWHSSRPDFQRRLDNVAAFAYSGYAYIADSPIATIATLPKPDRSVCLSFVRPADHSKALLQAITNLKLQAALDSMQDSHDKAKNSHAGQLLQALERTLSEISGSKFRFEMTTHPNPSLGVNWGNSTLTFDLLPDGLRSIIGWMAHAVVMFDLWQGGKSDPFGAEAIFLLDEIESHLHPAWQRRILPTFQRLFPRAQIFVATHSPFVIGSLNHGWIHSFRLGSEGKVTAEQPRPASEGDSYISVIEEILGVKEWYDPETEKLLADFRSTRDAAYAGDATAQSKARELAISIGERSMELGYLMGREMSQMDRRLAKNSSSS